MVETRINEKSGLTMIVLKPNNSASWSFNMKIIYLLAFIATYISIFYAFHGLWLIFPFAGLSVGFLLLCFYLRVRANFNTEVITFDENTVVVERGHYHAEKSWRYQRLWTKIFVKKSATLGYPKQIFIRSHGKELELGSFLNNKDKEILIKELQNIIYA